MSTRIKDLTALAATAPSYFATDSSADGTRKLLCNLAGGAAPTVNDDSSAGYAVGSTWLHTGSGYYICTSATVGAAAWTKLNVSAYGSSPADVGTAAASSGSSAAFAKGDHVHASPLIKKYQTGQEISAGAALSTSIGVYFIDLTGASFNLSLPDPTTVVGYRWLIVDKYGAAGASKTLTLTRNNVADKINGATSDLACSVTGFAMELVCESPGEWVCRPPADAYIVGAAGNWSGSPTTVTSALDRLAAAVAGLLAGPIP